MGKCMWKMGFRAAVCALCILALAGCKTPEERAEAHFQAALELLAAGDTARARVEFRNVFQQDRTHLEARLAFAQMLRDEGNLRGAYEQYLRVAEQNPENLEVRQTLSELAFDAGNWDEFIRHGTATVELDGASARSRSIALGLDYRTAIIEEDKPAQEAVVSSAETLLAELPESGILNKLLADQYARNGDATSAIERIDVLIAANPDQRDLYNQRLVLLAQLQDRSGIEAQLRDMFARFPDDSNTQSMLFRFYVADQRLEDAESFLREISAPNDEDPVAFRSLIRFLLRIGDEDAARIELARGIAESPRPNIFKEMLAVLDFETGDREAAIATLEEALADEDIDAEAEETQDIKVTLARMFVATDNQVGAQRLVEEVLEANSGHTDALKMRAAWQIEGDDPDSAISNLRLALDNAPNDVQALNLMYEAHVRIGERDLARSFLSLAVDASGNAPEPSLRYARLLIDEERYLPAEDVLIPALRRDPRNIDLLRALGVLYLRTEDFIRTEQVIETLDGIEDDTAGLAAKELRAELLYRQSGTEEALQFLENLASSAEGDLRSNLTLLQAFLSTGKNAQALELGERIVEEHPDVLGLKQALAQAQLANGQVEAARASLREIVTEAPDQAVQAWLQLVRIAAAQGQNDTARAIVDEALIATNNHPDLLWANASYLERDGRYEEAIAIYEDLYARSSSSIVVANNLASLITTYRDDAESLERAWMIARRLRDLDVPAFQDTYGWIAYRRGEFETALPYLEAAAAGLPNDPIVQIHLGLTYAALERNEEALAQLQKAVILASPADTRAQIEKARAEIARLNELQEN